LVFLLNLIRRVNSLANDRYLIAISRREFGRREP